MDTATRDFPTRVSEPEPEPEPAPVAEPAAWAQPADWAEPEAPAAEPFRSPAPPVLRRHRAARAAPPAEPWPHRISKADAEALFAAAAWAAHDSALSPEDYASRAYRLKVSDAAEAADAATPPGRAD